MDLKVQVGTGRVAGFADVPDDVTGMNVLARRDVEAGLVGVERGQPITVVDQRVVAVWAV